mmetsp:Transcript_13871/g.24562  ORF Transcript_13871/g.24562 Transcript_13871/m.24562 type:complete len:201 (-) Transcript_13871:1164-1766(-)
MGSPQEVHRVRIINRQDCCSGNLATITIAVSDVMPAPPLGQEISTTTAVCTYQAGPLTDAEYTFTCDTPVIGRFLSVQKQGGLFLALCEVEVYAQSATASPAPPSTPAPALSNVALGKNTGHSSAGWGGVSSRAVDGSQSGVRRASFTPSSAPPVCLSGLLTLVTHVGLWWICVWTFKPALLELVCSSQFQIDINLKIYP